MKSVVIYQSISEVIILVDLEIGQRQFKPSLLTIQKIVAEDEPFAEDVAFNSSSLFCLTFS
jgi:hypothetical protein